MNQNLYLLSFFSKFICCHQTYIRKVNHTQISKFFTSTMHECILHENCLFLFSSRLKHKQNFYLLSNMWKKLQWRIRAHNLTINMFDLDKYQIIKSIFTNKIISYYIVFFVLSKKMRKKTKQEFFLNLLIFGKQAAWLIIIFKEKQLLGIFYCVI